MEIFSFLESIKFPKRKRAVHDLDLISLRVFVQVCESRSLGRAADRARLSASSVSKRLTQLEDRVGARLLERRRQGVVLTAVGERVLEHARAILLSADRIERDVALQARGLHGRVQLLATGAVMLESLAADLAHFLGQPAHRDIRVDVEEMVSPAVVEGVRAGAASLGICWDAIDLGGLKTEPYRNDHLCVAVPRRHPLTRLRRVRYADMLDFEQVRMPLSSHLELMLHREAARVAKAVSYRVTVRSYEAALRFVQAGSAVALVPREVAQIYGEALAVELLPLHEPWVRRQFVLCHRGRETLPPAALLLLEALRAKA